MARFGRRAENAVGAGGFERTGDRLLTVNVPWAYEFQFRSTAGGLTAASEPQTDYARLARTTDDRSRAQLGQ